MWRTFFQWKEHLCNAMVPWVLKVLHGNINANNEPLSVRDYLKTSLAKLGDQIKPSNFKPFFSSQCILVNSYQLYVLGNWWLICMNLYLIHFHKICYNLKPHWWSGLGVDSPPPLKMCMFPFESYLKISISIVFIWDFSQQILIS